MSDKFFESLNELESAFNGLEVEPKNKLIRDATCKRFEVAAEYAWKAMKKAAESDGIEIYSPKESIRAAAKLGLIDSPEDWIKFINARNFAVHDYFGIDSNEHMKLVKEFISEARKFQSRLIAR